jgi:hypothetical protein
LQAIIPLEIDKNKYLFNYLQNHNIVEEAKYFTPLWRQSLDHINAKPEDINAQVACCKGVPDDRVKKLALEILGAVLIQLDF